MNSAARFIIWIAGAIVPGIERRDFREAWLAELEALTESAGDGGFKPGPLRFALGAFTHAVVERTDDWRIGGTWRDVRDAVRQIRREPAYAAGVTLVIALAVGANAAIFSVVNAVFLRTPPGISADRLVQVGRMKPNGEFDSLSFPLVEDIRERSSAFEATAAFATERFLIDDGSGARLAAGQTVTAGYFATLGARLAAGREFTPADERDGRAAAVIAYDLWRRRFGLDPAISGRTLSLNGVTAEIVGVAPPGFIGADIAEPAPDVWVPISFPASDAAGRYTSRLHSWVSMVGRLAPGASSAQANRMLESVRAAIDREFPGTLEAPLRVAAGVGLPPDARPIALRVSLLLTASVVVVLLIACANVAGLLMARGIARRRELALRMAIGASRFRIARAAVVESLTLSVLAGAAAAAVTQWTAAGVRRLMPYDLAIGFEPDARVFAFTFTVAAAAGLLLGLFPALAAARTSALHVMREAGRGPSARRLRAGLIVVQLALSFVLLSGTAVLVRSLAFAARVAPGFQPDGVAAMTLDFRSARWSDARVASFVDIARDRLRAANVASAVGFARRLPVADPQARSSVVAGPRPSGALPPVAVSNAVDPGFFTALGMPVVAGRGFEPADGAAGERVAVVSAALARQLWGGESALGRQLSGGAGRVTVVGVVADAALRSLQNAHEPAIYVPLAQQRAGEITVVARALPARTDRDVLNALGRVAEDLAPGVPIARSAPLRTLMGAAMGETRLTAILLSLYGASAALLAVIGVSALLLQSVRERRPELGVRLALGADPAALSRSVVWHALRLTATGVAIGGVAWVAASASVRHLTFGIGSADPASLAAVVGVFAVAALIASWSPARTAGRTDPLSSLRAQ